MILRYKDINMLLTLISDNKRPLYERGQTKNIRKVSKSYLRLLL